MIYRGFSIEQERDGSYSVFRFGYLAGHFRNVAEAQAYIVRKLD
jgi:hypothetical protein